MTKEEKELLVFEMKELTKSQQKKADKIVQLLLELQKENVWPVVIDGGGGSGLEFYSCSKSNRNDVENIFLDYDFEKLQLVKDYLYTPNKTWNAPIPTVIP